MANSNKPLLNLHPVIHNLLDIGLVFAAFYVGHYLFFNILSQQMGAPFWTWFFLVPLFVLGALWGIAKLRGQGFESYGLRRGQMDKTGWTVCFLTLAAWLVLFLLIRPILISNFGIEADVAFYNPLIGQLDHYVLWLARVWLALALVEELIFRGLVLTRVAGLFPNFKFNFYVAAVAQAVLFGYLAPFQGPMGVVITSLAGLVFGLAFVWGGQRLAPLVLARGLAFSILLTSIYLDLGWF